MLSTIPDRTAHADPSVGHASPARHRILISANATSPARGSEPGVGWQICSRLAKYHDVTVLCSPGVPGKDFQDFRAEVADHLARTGPIPGLTLHFVDPPPLSFWFQRESKLCRRTLYYTGYAAWQRKALKVARELHRPQPFDLVHHLNITGYREPGYLWKMDLPFVWGPIGGAASFPDGYFDLLSRKDRFFYKLRNFTNRFQKSSSRCRSAAAKAKHIWAISIEDAEMVERQWNKPAQRMLETGATIRPTAVPRDYDGSRPLRVVWSGQHFGRKALPILLRAMQELKNRSIELTVLGDGPATVDWKATAGRLGLNNIIWTGQVSQQQAMATVSNADVLAFTSVLEGTPHVVLESLSLGVPVICHNACGMGVAVTDDCGVRLEMVDSETSIHAFASAIGSLAADPDRVVRLSHGAIRRAAELSWDSKVEQILKVYDGVIEASRKN